MSSDLEIPDQTNRVIMVTGANTGIGEATARALARAGAHVLLACRSEEKAAPVVEALRREAGHDRVEYTHLDLGDLASVRACAEAFLARDLQLDVLINNAGVVAPGQTKDGFELVFGVNHLGHFLLTELLLERLEQTGTGEAPARVVNVASRAHYRCEGVDFDALTRPTASTSAFPEYTVSKLANVLHAAELARRLDGRPVEAYSLHPGVVASNVWRRVPGPVRWLMKRFMITNEEGAQTSLHCATSPDALGCSGDYFDECRPKKPSALARDEALARELWECSEEWVNI